MSVVADTGWPYAMRCVRQSWNSTKDKS